MEMPLTHSEPRLTMWSTSPSMVMSFPSRTVATIPQPHEQKLHEVVNSFTSDSFIDSVAARAAGTSTRPTRVSPPAPRNPSRRRSLRLTPAAALDDLMTAPLVEGTAAERPSRRRPRLYRRPQTPSDAGAMRPWSHVPKDGPAGEPFCNARSRLHSRRAGGCVVAARACLPGARVLRADERQPRPTRPRDAPLDTGGSAPPAGPACAPAFVPRPRPVHPGTGA